MNYATSHVRKIVVLLMIFSFHSFQYANQTETDLLELKYKLYLANKNYPAESIYLQTDRPSYWANDDLWFKAYLQSVVDSSNIYVELINSTGYVIQKKIFIAFDGLAYGDFHLPDTISSGVYQIRSYTNWMRNFDESAFFHKNFIVWNLKDKEIKDQSQVLKTKAVDVQFFPEGGTFLSGIRSKLGFKAVDENGIGIDISGMIQDNEGKLIASFKSQFKGMGNVDFIPEEGKKYSAIVNVMGKTKKVELPDVQANGVALTMETHLKDKLLITITELDKNEVSDHHYYLIGQTRGVVFYTQEIEQTNGVYRIKIDKDKLPSGVFQLTLFNSNLIPECERLSFINHNDYVQLKIKTNRKIYTTREKIQADITCFNKDSMPHLANLSMTVYANESLLQLEEYHNNILTHFLLNSDLKGRIEEPAYYFKDTEIETLTALDNLMLTQGWRRFSWKAILANDFPTLDFEHESAITVKGSVSTKFFEKPLPHSTVTLIFDQQNYKYYEQETDSLGRFEFDNFFFYNETSVLLKAEKQNGHKNTWLDIDSRSQKSPVVELLPVDYILKNDQKVNTTYQVSMKDSSLITRKWHITDTILLNDIDIFGVKKKNIEEEDFIVFNSSDMTLSIKEDDYTISNVFDMMQFRLPGIQVRFDDEPGSVPTIRISGNSGQPILLLDGFPIDGFSLAAMPVSSFDRIDVQRMAVMYGSKGINGAINFISKVGMKNTEVLLPAGVERINLLGYSVFREFYSPSYANNEPSVIKNDFRSTLYWNPNIWTNKKGKAQINFYNSDQPGEVQIVVEGITTDGRLCRGTCSYSIAY